MKISSNFSGAGEMLNIFDFLALFIVSLLLNLFIFSIIKSGFLGAPLKERFIYLLENRKNLLSIVCFILSLFLIVYLNNYSIIHLDSVVVTTTVENVKVAVSGDAVTSIFNGLGGAAVFTAGARIGATFSGVAQHKIGILPKTGLIGGIGCGFSATFAGREFLPAPERGRASTSSGEAALTAETGPLRSEIKVETFKTTAPEGAASGITNILEDCLGLPLSGAGRFNRHLKADTDFSVTKSEITNATTISGDSSPEKASKVLAEIENTFPAPEWGNIFIKSPLEPSGSGGGSDPLNQYLLDILSNELILNFVTVYLLVMLLIIFICKLILTKDIQFNKLKKYPLGSYINYFLVKYFSIWQTSGNIWIFLIVISLIVFNVTCVYANYNLIITLK